MLFRNLTNHQRWLAISSCFTNSKRSNLGLHLGGCLNQENLINSCSACGWQYSVFSLSILEFYSFQKQLLCGVRGILLGIWLLQDNYIILHFRSSQLLCGVSSRCLGFCLFQENWRVQGRFQKQLLCGVKGGWQLPTMNFRFLCNSGSCIAPCE